MSPIQELRLLDAILIDSIHYYVAYSSTESVRYVYTVKEKSFCSVFCRRALHKNVSQSVVATACTTAWRLERITNFYGEAKEHITLRRRLVKERMKDLTFKIHLALGCHSSHHIFHLVGTIDL